jgi:hypothetical protein
MDYRDCRDDRSYRESGLETEGELETERVDWRPRRPRRRPKQNLCSTSAEQYYNKDSPDM